LPEQRAPDGPRAVGGVHRGPLRHARRVRGPARRPHRAQRGARAGNPARHGSADRPHHARRRLTATPTDLTPGAPRRQAASPTSRGDVSASARTASGAGAGAVTVPTATAGVTAATVGVTAATASAAVRRRARARTSTTIACVPMTIHTRLAATDGQTPFAAATMPMRPAAVRLVSWNGADDAAQRPRLTMA